MRQAVMHHTTGTIATCPVQHTARGLPRRQGHNVTIHVAVQQGHTVPYPGRDHVLRRVLRHTQVRQTRYVTHYVVQTAVV